MDLDTTTLALAGVVAVAAALLGLLLLPVSMRLALAAPPFSLTFRLGPWRFSPRLSPRRSGSRKRGGGSSGGRSGGGGPAAGGGAARPLASGMLPRLAPALRYLRRRLVVRRLRLRGHLGGSDAAETALLYGGAWALWGCLVAALGAVLRLQPGAARLELRPDYRRTGWRLEGECIVVARAGQVIAAMLILGWTALRLGRSRRPGPAGDEGVEGDGRASDPGADADGHGEP